eukprot:6534437-Prymnesium_polylepis.1
MDTLPRPSQPPHTAAKSTGCVWEHFPPKRQRLRACVLRDTRWTRHITCAWGAGVPRCDECALLSSCLAAAIS